METELHLHIQWEAALASAGTLHLCGMEGKKKVI